MAEPKEVALSFFPESASEGFLLCRSSAGAELSFPGRCRRGAAALPPYIRRIENLNFPKENVTFPKENVCFSRERERRVLVVYVFRWGRVVFPAAVPARCRRVAGALPAYRKPLFS